MKRLLFVGTKTIHLVCRTFRLASVKQQLPPPTVKCLEKSFLKPVFSPLPFSAFKIKTFSLHSAATTLPFTIFSFPLPWTSYVEGVEGLHRPNCQTNFVIVPHELSVSFWTFYKHNSLLLGPIWVLVDRGYRECFVDNFRLKFWFSDDERHNLSRSPFRKERK